MEFRNKTSTSVSYSWRSGSQHGVFLSAIPLVQSLDRVPANERCLNHVLGHGPPTALHRSASRCLTVVPEPKLFAVCRRRGQILPSDYRGLKLRPGPKPFVPVSERWLDRTPLEAELLRSRVVLHSEHQSPICSRTIAHVVLRIDTYESVSPG